MKRRAGRIYIVHYEQQTPALTVLDASGTVLGTWTAASLGIATELSEVAVSRDGNTLFILDQRTPAGGLVKVFTVEHGDGASRCSEE